MCQQLALDTALLPNQGDATKCTCSQKCKITAPPEDCVSTEHNSISPARVGVRYLNALARRHFAALICLACCVPLLLLHFDELWRFRHFRYLPLATVGFCTLLWKCWSHELSPIPISRIWDRCLMLFAAIALACSIMMSQPYVAAIAAASICGAILLRLRREGEIERFIPIWLFLVFVIQLPEQWNLRVLHVLQTLSTRWASVLIDVIGVTHARIGNIIWVNGRQYFSQQAFNGLPFLFSIIAATGWWVILKRRRVVHSTFLLGSAIFWCVALNTLWIVLVIYCQQRLQVDLQQNPLNQITRIGVFAAALAMLLCSDIAFANYPNATRWVMMGGPVTSNEELISLRIKRSDIFELIVAGAFGVLLLVQITQLVSGVQQSSTVSKRDLIQFICDDLPNDVDGWQRGEFQSEQRADADIRGLRHVRWNYQKGDHTIYVSVNFPFHTWHDDQASYEAAGINLDNPQTIENDSFPETVVTHRVSMIDGSQGQMIATLIGQDQQSISLPNTNSRLSFLKGDTLELASSRTALQHPGYQIRVIETAPKITEADREALMRLHTNVSRLLRARIVDKGETVQ